MKIKQILVSAGILSVILTGCSKDPVIKEVEVVKEVPVEKEVIIYGMDLKPLEPIATFEITSSEDVKNFYSQAQKNEINKPYILKSSNYILTTDEVLNNDDIYIILDYSENETCKVLSYSYELSACLIGIKVPVNFTNFYYQDSLRNCYNLRFIEIPSSALIHEIPNLQGCLSLREFSFPENTEEGKLVSWRGNCDRSGLRKIYFPLKYKILATWPTFNHCYDLEEITFEGEKSDWNDSWNYLQISVQNCYKLKKYDIPLRYTSFEMSRLSGCRNLEEIVVNATATYYFGSNSVEFPKLKRLVFEDPLNWVDQYGDVVDLSDPEYNAKNYISVTMSKSSE